MQLANHLNNKTNRGGNLPPPTQNPFSVSMRRDID
jgi:hypothetical protein